jgi:hypothetical protein
LDLAHRDVDCLAVAFLSALIIGSALHYRKIVQNEWYGYPDEWFPSVSATIGDRYPERSIFMLLIAITSGMPVPQPLLVLCVGSFADDEIQGRDLRSLDCGTCSQRNPAAPSPKQSPSSESSGPWSAAGGHISRRLMTTTGTTF